MLDNFNEIFSSSIGAGGLFDFNATLPFLALQFLILTFVLNNILYNPLLNAIDERNNYIHSTLTNASFWIKVANAKKQANDIEIDYLRKSAQSLIAVAQKMIKEDYDREVIEVQDNLNYLLVLFVLCLELEKAYSLDSLEIELLIYKIGILIQQKILFLK